MQSTKPQMQTLMDEVDRLDPKDPELEAKLQHIAEKVAAEQGRARATTLPPVDMEAITDPSDTFACEACQ